MANDYAATDYRDRDRLVGGTDSPWVEAGTFNGWVDAIDTDADSVADTIDMRRGGAGQASTGGTLSQSDLAS